MNGKKKILLLTTGGTIASVPGGEGLVPHRSDVMERELEQLRTYYDITVQDLMCLDSSNIRPEEWQRICRQNPAFATDLALYVGDVLRLMCFDAEKQSIDDVQTRLATFMCLYIESSAETCAEKNVVPMTQESLASAINASRIQTSRICAQLKADGIISIGRKRVEVLDLPALMAMRQ